MSNANASSLILLIASVIFSSSAQLLFKKGVSGVGGDEDIVGFFIRVIKSPHVWVGMFLFGIGLVIWLFALRHVPISKAYAFVALGIVLVTLSGFVFLGERVNLSSLVGCGFVVIGLLIMASDKF